MSGFFKPGVESGELGGQPSGDFAKVFTEFLQQLITGQPSQGTPDKVSTGPRGGTIPGTPAADPIDKTEGIMKQLGMERYLVDFYTMRIDDIVRKIDDLWDNRERISQMLQTKMKAIRGQALYNAELVREYCVTGQYK